LTIHTPSLKYRKWLLIGAGYCARAFVSNYKIKNATGTTRSNGELLQQNGITPIITDFTSYNNIIAENIRHSEAILISVAPDHNGDQFLRLYADDIITSPTLSWIGYLSSTSVYGNHDGQAVDEQSKRNATSTRGINRIIAEDSWINLKQNCPIPICILRLSGIYGNGRSSFDKLHNGTASRIDKPNHLFSRTHVDDIAGFIAHLANNNYGDIYNVCDLKPASGREVIEYACKISGYPLPPLLDFTTAALSQMARSFYDDNRIILPGKLLQSGYTLKYPSYIEGLKAIFSNFNTGT
jgi:hypothetical protein